MTEYWLGAKKGRGAGFKILATDDVGNSNLNVPDYNVTDGVQITIPGMEKLVAAIPYVVSGPFIAVLASISSNVFRMHLYEICGSSTLDVSGEAISNVLKIGGFFVGE